MKGLPAVLLCMTFAVAAVGCGQDKGKAHTEKKATTQTTSKATTHKKASKAQKNGPTLAQKKQPDRTADCNRQANLRNLKGVDRSRFVNSCVGGRA